MLRSNLLLHSADPGLHQSKLSGAQAITTCLNNAYAPIRVRCPTASATDAKAYGERRVPYGHRASPDSTGIQAFGAPPIRLAENVASRVTLNWYPRIRAIQSDSLDGWGEHGELNEGGPLATPG